jgi:hypothetical protein
MFTDGLIVEGKGWPCSLKRTKTAVVTFVAWSQWALGGGGFVMAKVHANPKIDGSFHLLLHFYYSYMLEN